MRTTDEERKEQQWGKSGRERASRVYLHRLRMLWLTSHTHTHTPWTHTQPLPLHVQISQDIKICLRKSGWKWVYFCSHSMGNNFVRWCFTTWCWFVILLSLSVHLAWAVGVTVLLRSPAAWEQITASLSATCYRMKPPSSRTHAIPVLINLSLV